MEIHKNSTKTRIRPESRTLSVDDMGAILGIGRSSAYSMARKALESSKPFAVVKFGNTIRISKKSLEEYLVSVGL